MSKPTPTTEPQDDGTVPFSFRIASDVNAKIEKIVAATPLKKTDIVRMALADGLPLVAKTLSVNLEA